MPDQTEADLRAVAEAAIRAHGVAARIPVPTKRVLALLDTITDLRAEVERAEAKSDSRADRITRALGAEITRARAMRDEARADATALRDRVERVEAVISEWEFSQGDLGNDTFAICDAAAELRAALAPAPLDAREGEEA